MSVDFPTRPQARENGVFGAKITMVKDIIGVYYQNPHGRSTNPETLKEMLDEVHGMRKSHLPSYQNK